MNCFPFKIKYGSPRVKKSNRIIAYTKKMQKTFFLPQFIKLIKRENALKLRWKKGERLFFSSVIFLGKSCQISYQILKWCCSRKRIISPHNQMHTRSPLRGNQQFYIFFISLYCRLHFDFRIWLQWTEPNQTKPYRTISKRFAFHWSFWLMKFQFLCCHMQIRYRFPSFHQVIKIKLENIRW